MTLSNGQSNRGREKMGISKRPLLLGLAIVMGLGFIVYFRLWFIDYQISADDAELLRREFDLAHREAVDESAEWRSRFDEEREKTAECMRELAEIKLTSGKIAKDLPNTDERVERLIKENKDLLERVEYLEKLLKAEKLKCKSQ